MTKQKNTIITCLSVLMLCATLVTAAPDDELKPYAGLDDWVQDKDSRMAWWQQARFGMFIHWGLYSPAGGYWDGKKYPQHYAEWIQYWASVHPTEYGKQMKPKFQPKPGFAKEWAQVAKQAGMQYAVLTTKHHEGFTLFNSQHPYSLDNPITHGTNISPNGRDVVGEYSQAVRDAGLKVGFYYSLLDWQHPHAYELSLPGYSPKNKDRDYKQYVDYLHWHVKELMTQYGQIDILWPDYSNAQIQGGKWRTRELLKNLKQWQPNIVINNRFWNGLENRNGDYVTPEKYVPPTGIKGADWEVCHTMNESFGYSAHDNNWKTTDETIRLLVDIVSKGGNLLLNVGPDAKGDIPSECKDVLRGVGEWMADYSDAIYGTTASPFQDYTFDGRCTTKDLGNGKTRLYFILFTWPQAGQLEIAGLKNEVEAAMLMPTGAKCDFTKKEDSLIVKVPEKAPYPAASVVAVDIDGKPEVVSYPYPVQDAGRKISLSARDALIRGEKLVLENGGVNLGYWMNTNDVAFFPFLVKRPGKSVHKGGTVEQHPGDYSLILEYACAPNNGGQVEVSLGDQKFQVTIQSTGSWGNYQTLEIGQVTLSRPGNHFLFLRPISITEALMNLKSITLVPKD